MRITQSRSDYFRVTIGYAHDPYSVHPAAQSKTYDPGCGNRAYDYLSKVDLSKVLAYYIHGANKGDGHHHWENYQNNDSRATP
ncbi:hypothetical protein JIN85_19650 [Luteolibacter pohnpeiensis]|uniref:Uncharacterized protein n=2 Tax=Luteolibacter pohnpeiensis TaxID=454153 RepID=A0A934SBT0_9BACT|nr:hypothetical protein [Luteolibacter pohnpeiensis]